MIRSISITDYFQQYSHGLLLDVRSPGEYEHAHIPGARSLPLFTNDERKVVGTAYKQESRERAIKIGLKYFGPKMVKMVEEVEKLRAEGEKQEENECPIVVHCWRGGMRSAGVAWLLDLYGFEVYTIKGGYKSFRHWCLQQLDASHTMRIIGGYTGSGKTELLHALASRGEYIIDLEGLASHKGSAFGSINMPAQPSQEMFENKLAMALAAANDRTIWMEDESQRIGDVNMPFGFFKKMRSAPLYFLDIPFEERLDYIVKDYGKGDIEKLVNAIIRIQKRLGGLEAKNAIQCLLEQDIRGCFAILLRYYDKWYLKGLDQHRVDVGDRLTNLSLPNTNAAANATALMNLTAFQPA